MKILIYTPDREIGEWAKNRLEEFGRGMHIAVKKCTEQEATKEHWSFVILIGNCGYTSVADKPSQHFPLPASDEERTTLKRGLWALYRDTLRDIIGNKCSCGLYDTCHCH